MAGDQVPPCLTAYRSEKEPCEGSVQLNTAAPSGATDQLGCTLPGPDGFASGVEEKVWLSAGSANTALRRIDWIFTRVTPLLGDHVSVAIFNLKLIGCPGIETSRSAFPDRSRSCTSAIPCSQNRQRPARFARHLAGR